MERNIAWVLVASVGDDCLAECFPDDKRDAPGPVGSWTTFMKGVTDSQTTKCKLEYHPVVPLPQGDNVIKWYMDMIVQIANDLDLDHVFAHADEAINSKMLVISWLNPERYDKIITPHERLPHNLGEPQDSVLVSAIGGAIADGSVAQAIEGHHYYRSVCLHKQ
jgi:hypothetical protein